MMKWLLLIMALPTEQTTSRMQSWRMLKGSGAALLRDGVYLIPAGTRQQEQFAHIESLLAQAGGKSWLWQVEADPEPFQPLFDRTEGYQRLNSALEQLLSLSRTEQERALRRLRKSFATLTAIDFFAGESQRQMEQRLYAFQQQLTDHEPQGRCGVVKPCARADYQQRLWVTRADLWVDRLASAWLIRRFIDPDARFLWLEHPLTAPSEAVGFDFDGAEFNHLTDTTEGGSRVWVTFEVLIQAFDLTSNPALNRIAEIVHALDAGGLPVAEAAGLERLLWGLKQRLNDDDARLEAASQLWDDLELAYRSTQPSLRS